MNDEVAVTYALLNLLLILAIPVACMIVGRCARRRTAPLPARRGVAPLVVFVAGAASVLHRLSAERCLRLVIPQRCGRWVRVDTRGLEIRGGPRGVPIASRVAEFDERFVIRGRGRGSLRRLTPEVQAALWHLGSLGPISVEFCRRCLMITVGEQADRRSLLDRASELVVALGARPAVIVIVDELSRTGRCGSCGDTLSGALTICARCGLPQHAECFAFIGGCAAYGCERRKSA